MGAVGVRRARLLGPDAIGRCTVAMAVWAVAAVFVASGSTMTGTLDSARDSTSVGATIATALRLRAVTVPIGWIVVIGFVTVIGHSFEVAMLAVVVGVLTTLKNARNRLSCGNNRPIDPGRPA